MERSNVDFSRTLANFSDTLRRQNDDQKAAIFWQGKYDILYNEFINSDYRWTERYEDVAGKNLMMCIEITKKDEVIKAHEERIKILETEVADQKGIQDGNSETASAPGEMYGWMSNIESCDSVDAEGGELVTLSSIAA